MLITNLSEVGRPSGLESAHSTYSRQPWLSVSRPLQGPRYSQMVSIFQCESELTQFANAPPAP